MKFRDLMEELLIEASKLDILISKVGLNDKNAYALNELCGPLSIWMANKIIDHVKFTTTTWRSDTEPTVLTNSEVLYRINDRDLINTSTWREKITSIMDWIRVGLNGNLGVNKNSDFKTLLELSEKWHKSLGIGEGDINYVEENEIVRDYRQNGIGYYWTNLNTNHCGEEANRMGHCANTSNTNTLYSLRNNIQINPKYTLNKSVLTAAVGKDDGIIYQLKGGSNSKPAQEYHPYILDLLIHDSHIKGFGTEYDTKNDFKISDLGEEDVKKLYQVRPDLFSGRKEKKLLVKMGLLDKSQYNSKFKLTISSDDVDDWVDGDWTIRTWKDKNGINHKSTMFQCIVKGETWDMYESNGYDGDWKDAINYHVDKEDELRLWEIVRRVAEKDGIDITDLDLEDSIEECDIDDIKNALRDAQSNAESDAYQTHLYETLHECLEFYGTVEQMDDSGIIIDCDFDSITSDTDEDSIEEAMDTCNDKLDCALRELMGNDIDKPDFSIDERWSPSVDDKNFKEFLNDRLNEI